MEACLAPRKEATCLPRSHGEKSKTGCHRFTQKNADKSGKTFCQDRQVTGHDFSRAVRTIYKSGFWLLHSWLGR